MIKHEISIIDAVPSKRLYRSIIADYDLTTAICELVDNVLDSRKRRNIRKKSDIEIVLDFSDQSITIKDNAGGVAEGDLPKLISPGASHDDGEHATIGIFGVGSKRAAVAISRDIKISTRYGNKNKCFQLEYDDAWLADEDWHIPVYEVDLLPPSTTKIVLSRLRFQIAAKDELVLAEHLGVVYSKFLKSADIAITINKTKVKARFFDQWSYPPKYEPREFTKRVYIEGKTLPVLFKITSGITIERGSLIGDYGVFVYCNQRLIMRAARPAEFGFQPGMAGIAHPRMSNARVILELIGPAADMPWNSSKTGINFNHRIFDLIRSDVQTSVKNATSLSKKLQEQFDTAIAPYSSGKIVRSELKRDQHISASKLPVVPKGSSSTVDSIKELNKKIAAAKPWTVGAYEGIIAVESIKKLKVLQQKNRLLLVILDSTLEIAFKDFLANELPSPMADTKLQTLFSNRVDVHREMEKNILSGDPIWKKVRYYYKQRCELVHRKVSVAIADNEVEDFQRVVEKLLNTMYTLRFPKR